MTMQCKRHTLLRFHCPACLFNCMLRQTRKLAKRVGGMA